MNNLIVIQGIGSNNYFYKEVLASKVSNNYNKIINVPTEEVFDSSSHKNPFIWDVLGDLWYFYNNENVRKQVCNLTREYIKANSPCDVVCHSLGCQIFLTCGKWEDKPSVEKAYLLGSPLGFFGFRGIVLDHLSRYGFNVEYKALDYVYGKYDPVAWAPFYFPSKSHKYNPKIMHASSKYLKFLETVHV